MKKQKRAKARFYLAGAGGFEPPNVGSKVRCLTSLATPHRVIILPLSENNVNSSKEGVVLGKTCNQDYG